jgi:hypothetical protein
MTRPALRFLQHKLHSTRLDGVLYLVGLMADDHVDVLWWNHPPGCLNHVRQKRFAPDFV